MILLRKTLCFMALAALLGHLFTPPVQAIQNVDRMSEKQLIALVDSYITHTVKPRELAVRKKPNLLSHKVMGVKIIPNEYADTFTSLSEYKELGKPFLILYVAVDYQVAKESKYRLNGINYRLLTMVKTGSEWDFYEYATAPVHTILQLEKDTGKKIAFGTEDEKEMAEITKQHIEGKYVNRKGEIVGDLNTDNIPSSSDLQYEMTGEARTTMASEPGDIPSQVNRNFHRPKWIRVLMTQPTNLKYYGCTKQCVQRIDFLDYLKHVLPLEWDKEAHPEALKAGALTVKMYGWYSVAVDPKARYIDADIKDTTANQVYAADFEDYFYRLFREHGLGERDSRTRSQQEAELARKVSETFHQPGIAGVAFKENVLDNLIDVGHKQSGTAKSGIVSQGGSDKLAKTNHMAYTGIIRYYVDGSPIIPKGAKVEFVRYAK